MVPPRRKPPLPSESSLDFDDGRTSRLEKALVWFFAVCALIGVLGTLSEILQGLRTLGLF